MDNKINYACLVKLCVAVVLIVAGVRLGKDGLGGFNGCGKTV